VARAAQQRRERDAGGTERLEQALAELRQRLAAWLPVGGGE